jgi:peroxin-19
MISMVSYLPGRLLIADVLSSINAPTRPKASASIPAAPVTASADPSSDDFEAELAQGMESLLRELSGTPGPFNAPSPDASTRAGSEPKMSEEDEEKAWQKAMEMMLSGEGLDALGLAGESKQPAQAKAPVQGSTTARSEQTYDEKIADIMKNIGKGAEAVSLHACLYGPF